MPDTILSSLRPSRSDGATPHRADAKRHDIQGLRALAALAVVGFHATDLLPGGFLGVDVFFVISGFVIAHLARREIAMTGGFSIGRFIRRRLRRVLPPMALVVLATTLLLGLTIDTPSRTAETLPLTGLAALAAVVNISFVANATDYFQTFQSNPLLHLWSLSVEIQFYALFALTVALLMKLRDRLGHGRVWTAVLATGVTAVSLAAALTIKSWHGAFHFGPPEVASFFLLPGRIWEFGLGILAKLAEGILARRMAKGAVAVLQGAAVAVLTISFLLGSNLWLVPGVQALAPCLATALLIAMGEQGFFARFLASPVLTYLGDRSYSIYLWQGPVIGVSAMLFATPSAIALAGGASVLLAIASASTVETVFRAPSARTGLASLTFPLTYAGVGLVCVAAYALVPVTVGRLEGAPPLRATVLDPKCDRQRGVLGISPCVYGASGRAKVLLIGDSHAGAISQALVDAAVRAGWQAHVATASACSVPEYPEDTAYRPSCAGYATDVLSYARREKVSLLVVQQFSRFYVGGLRIGPERWKQGLGSYLSAFDQAGIATLVVGDNLGLPQIVGRPFWVPTWSVDLSAAIRGDQEIEAAEQSAAGGLVHGRYFRARDYLCQGSICPVFDRDAWQYTDTDHLSYVGAAPLAAPLERVLRSLAE